MNGKKAALIVLLVAVMLYMAGGEVLLSQVLQYLMNSITAILMSILNLFVGLFHILNLGK